MNGTTSTPEIAAGGPPPDMHARPSPPEIAAGGPPPNFDIIVPALLSGDVIPFLGAGASIFHKGSLGDNQCPPSAKELARKLADTARFPNNEADAQQFREDLARVASYFAYVEGDREELRRCLREVFKLRFPPNRLHRTLARIARRKPILIITTNYDDMIERAFDGENGEEPVKYHLVVTAVDDGIIKHRRSDCTLLEAADPQKVNLSLDRGYSIIYKMHGSIDRHYNDYTQDHYVITEEDYVVFLGKMLELIPGTIKIMFMQRKSLFLGYSLRDWNFRVMLSRALQERAIQGKSALKSWSIQRKCSSIDKELWRNKNVSIHDMDLNDFSQKLDAYVNERLGAY